MAQKRQERMDSVFWPWQSVIVAAVATTLLLGCGGDNNGNQNTPTPTIPPQEDTPTLTPVPTATSVPGEPGQPGAGVSSSIVGATVDATGVIAVTFTLTDDDGVPVQPVLASTSDPN